MNKIVSEEGIALAFALETSGSHKLVPLQQFAQLLAVSAVPSMRSLSLGLAAFKGALSTHTGLMRLYARAMMRVAQLQALRGRPLLAVRLVLRGWRAAGTEGLGTRSAARARAWISGLSHNDGALRSVGHNPFWADYVHSDEARSVRNEFWHYSQRDRVRLRYPRDPDDPERQGDLLVLKRHDPLSGERGVLLVNYTEGIRRFTALFDLSALATRYAIVLEPSWWGYQDATFLQFLGSDLDVIVQCPAHRDYEFIVQLQSNLVATRVGAGDWVDPHLFRAGPPRDSRRYDVVMVSSWNPLKRHSDLFAAMRRLQRTGHRPLRVALVGYPSTWTRQNIEQLASRYGVRQQCEVFESVPPAEVARIVGDSRAYLLLSRTEGANRALYEAFFCDTPALVYRHHRGVNTDHITDQTGVLFEDGLLSEAIRTILAGTRFGPREWALAHTGYSNSSRTLNEMLQSLARKRGAPWTHGMVEKKNAPNAVYAEPGAWREFESEYDRLSEFVFRSDSDRSSAVYCV